MWGLVMLAVGQRKERHSKVSVQSIINRPITALWECSGPGSMVSRLAEASNHLLASQLTSSHWTSSALSIIAVSPLCAHAIVGVRA